jgi:hypothetical protein
MSERGEGGCGGLYITGLEVVTNPINSKAEFTVI